MRSGRGLLHQSSITNTIKYFRKCLRGNVKNNRQQSSQVDKCSNLSRSAGSSGQHQHADSSHSPLTNTHGRQLECNCSPDRTELSLIESSQSELSGFSYQPRQFVFLTNDCVLEAAGPRESQACKDSNGGILGKGRWFSLQTTCWCFTNWSSPTFASITCSHFTYQLKILTTYYTLYI